MNKRGFRWLAVGCTSLLRCTGHLAVSEALQEEIDSAVLMLLSYLAHLGEECGSASAKCKCTVSHGVTCRRPLEDEPHAAITSEAEIFSLMYNAAAPYAVQLSWIVYARESDWGERCS